MWERRSHSKMSMETAFPATVPTQIKPWVRLFDVRPLVSVTQLLRVENPTYIYIHARKKHLLETFHAQRAKALLFT